jgi:hypothetical protein
MKKVEPREIFPYTVYAQIRPAYRQEIIAEKGRRRLQVGDRISLLFENRKTVKYQVQEMCWAEKITDPEMIQAELDVYNELIPGEGELSATLFIEITDQKRARQELERFVGIDESVYLIVGNDRIRAYFEPGRMTRERIAAVQYIRFRLNKDQSRAFFEGKVYAGMAVDHPHYRVEVEIPPHIRATLAQDLT